MKPLKHKTKVIVAIVTFFMAACILLLIFLASRSASTPSGYSFRLDSSPHVYVRPIFESTPEPEPIPRNVRILIDTTHATHSKTRHTLFELNGNILEVTRLGQAGPDVIYSGERLSFFEALEYMEYIDESSLCYEGIEDFDMSLLDDFNECRNFPGLSGLVVRQSIRIKPSEDIASVELSQEQLEDVWRRIDTVVRRYEQPSVQNGIGHTNIMAVIGGEFYFSTMGGQRIYPPPVDTRPRRERDDNPFAAFRNEYLVRLAHELIDLSPITTGWEPRYMTEQ